MTSLMYKNIQLLRSSFKTENYPLLQNNVRKFLRQVELGREIFAIQNVDSRNRQNARLDLREWKLCECWWDVSDDVMTQQTASKTNRQNTTYGEKN